MAFTEEPPTKICTKCHTEYLATIEFFLRRKNSKYGLRAQCRKCINQQQRDRYNRDYKYDEKYKQKANASNKRDYKKHYKARRAKGREYDKRTMPQRIQKQMNRYYNDENFRIIFLLRRRLRAAFQAYGKKKSQSAGKYGIDYNAILQKLGPRPGTDYHIDHIIPCCAFDHTDPEQIKKCWSPENLQWLPAHENQIKGGKY
jgi:hypothetical protein